MPLETQTKRLVLYADDDPDDLDFVRESFAQHAKDIELVSFNDAIGLLQFIQAKKNEEVPCLIILDINMPCLGGKEALRLLRDLDGYEDVPAVLFSTSNLPHDAQFARSYGAGFISKPLSSIQMDIIVKNFLDYCKENAG